MNSVFGIDFGTTNTRIAYFDGQKPIMISVEDRRGRAYTIPTMLGYQNGKPVVFGEDAREAASNTDIHICENIKWILDREDPLDIGGHLIEPYQVVADFFEYLKTVVKKTASVREDLERIALTVPVNYSFQSRLHLCQACEKAGIEVIGVFHEPVAALYCHAFLNHHNTTAAVFDWGGGTLDVATVRLEDGKAQVKAMDGMKLGGDDFDRMIVDQAVRQFLRENNDLGILPEDIIEHPTQGAELKLLAEQAKIELSTQEEGSISRFRFISDRSIDFVVKRKIFRDWIKNDVERGIGCLRRAIQSTRVAEALVNPILMSGGTCNIPWVQLQMQQEFGSDRVVTHLPFSSRSKDPVPEQDVSHATAIGAALLAVFGAHPTLTHDVGVRIADATGVQDAFHPIFRAGQALDFTDHKEEFFITDTRTGVARLLLCELVDGDIEPEGRLLRIIPVPIDIKETRIEVSFQMGRHLVMQVSGSGRVVPCRREETETFIHDLSYAFEVPQDRNEILS